MRHLTTTLTLPLLGTLLGISFLVNLGRADVVNFEELTLLQESQWYGSDSTYNSGFGEYGGFTSGIASFNNYHEYYYNEDMNSAQDYWEGWAYSNHTDTNSTGNLGQFTAMATPGGGQGDTNYSVGFCGWYLTTTISFTSPVSPTSAYFTNTGYTYDSLMNGDAFAKRFGGNGNNGNHGTDPDWFRLTITAYDSANHQTGTPIDFYLADYRFSDSSQDYIITNWQGVDLTALGNQVSSIQFTMDSSDHLIYNTSNGPVDYGMCTPGYFAMDNLTFTPVPEPSSLILLIAGVFATLAWQRLRK